MDQRKSYYSFHSPDVMSEHPAISRTAIRCEARKRTNKGGGRCHVYKRSLSATPKPKQSHQHSVGKSLAAAIFANASFFVLILSVNIRVQINLYEFLYIKQMKN